MSIAAIVQEVERRAKSKEIGRLQEIRKELKNKKRLPGYSIFNDSTIKDSYAFHYGGRTELQFNIGSEPDDRIRHGVAFSFEPSHTLPDPDMLIPSVERFNEFLRVHPDQFSDMLMWYWDKKGKRSSEYSPTPIHSDLIRSGMFVFMGSMQPSNAIDYDVIVTDFVRLLTMYRFVEGHEAYPATSLKTSQGFQFKPGCTVKLSKTKASYAERQLNVSLRHNEIQNALHEHLVSVYGKNNVGTELDNADGRVDVVVRRDGEYWFYEIKTAMSARGCIAVGLAQLLEYSFWPGAQEAEKLIIVGEPPLDADSRKYLACLNERFEIPISYQQFDLGKGAIVR